MFCKGASFLLLAQCFQATSANSLQGSENTPCTSDKCGQSMGVSILQIGAEEHRTSNLLYEPPDVDGSADELVMNEKEKTSHTKFKSLEHWQDIMQYNLFSASDLVKGIPVSKEKWAQAFDKLDKNGDGEIDGDDLAESHAETAGRHVNVSQDDYRLAVAQMAKQFPEFSDFMIAHEPVLVFLSEMNESVPDDAPVPDDESIAMFQKRRRNELALLEEANGCHQAFGKFAFEMIIFQLQFANIYLKPHLGDQPPAGWVQKLINPLNDGTAKDLVKSIAREVKNQNALAATRKMWDLLKALFELGLTRDLIEEAISNMSWWDWAKLGVSMTASLTVQMATGGTYMIAKMVIKITDWLRARHGAGKWGLFKALYRTIDACLLD